MGGSTMRLFTTKKYISLLPHWLTSSTLRRGQQRLLLHRGRKADPAWETSTPSELAGEQDEMGRLEEVGF